MVTEINRKIPDFQIQCNLLNVFPVSVLLARALCIDIPAHTYKLKWAESHLPLMSLTFVSVFRSVHIIYMLRLDWTVRLFSPATRTHQSSSCLSDVGLHTFFFRFRCSLKFYCTAVYFFFFFILFEVRCFHGIYKRWNLALCRMTKDSSRATVWVLKLTLHKWAFTAARTSHTSI